MAIAEQVVGLSVRPKRRPSLLIRAVLKFSACAQLTVLLARLTAVLKYVVLGLYG